MNNFADRLFGLVEAKRSVVVVGLDPRAASLPAGLIKGMSADNDAVADAFLSFNKGIIDATAQYAVAVKPQIAFYEELGPAGVATFAETCEYAQRAGLIVIADVKRGDIGTTASAYAGAFLGGAFCSDAATVNPYLGADSLTPFAEKCANGHGIFVLVRTSNNGAADLQDLHTQNGRLYEVVGDLVANLGRSSIGSCGFSSIGAVVGATWPGELTELRKRLPSVPFLVPGYGAQGATVEDIRNAFREDGLGAVVNSSRGIIFAYKDAKTNDWQRAAADAAKSMRDEFRAVLGWK